jgi:hypothetical protein
LVLLFGGLPSGEDITAGSRPARRKSDESSHKLSQRPSLTGNKTNPSTPFENVGGVKSPLMFQSPDDFTNGQARMKLSGIESGNGNSLGAILRNKPSRRRNPTQSGARSGTDKGNVPGKRGNPSKAGGINRVGSHSAVGGEFAADDGDDAVRCRQHGMTAG